MWEMFNEMDLGGHAISPQVYTMMYDAIALGIKQVQPKTEFVGLALGSTTTDMSTALSWLEYFLNTSNHHSNAPLDWISYHYYALPNSRNNSVEFEEFFTAADTFLHEVAQIQAIRKRLAPWVKTTVDELGVILPNDNAPNPGAIPNIYWNAAGAMYAYIFGNIIEQGIEVLGESQLIGYPTQYPSVSMMDWVTGKPNARYWVLYLLHNSFHVGDHLVSSSCSNSTLLYAQGFLTSKGKSVLLINKTNQAVNVVVKNIGGGELSIVDESTYENPPMVISLTNSTFSLSAFAVAVLVL